MIEWLSNWLQNIIIIVLLATFVDMLLPSSSMQKYGRMVLGFLVILTIISPIINLFSDLSIHDAINRLEQQAFPTGKKETTQRIAFGSEQLTQENKNKMIKQVEGNMLLKARELILQEMLPVEIQSLSLEADIVNQEWQVRKLSLFLTDKLVKEDKEVAKEESSIGNEVKEIDSIQIVHISLDKTILGTKANKELDEALIKDIKTILSKEWGFPKDMIIVDYQ